MTSITSGHGVPPGKQGARIAGRTAAIVVLCVVAILVVAPIVWAVSTSLRTPATSFSQPPRWFPAHPRWSNYKAVFQQVTFGQFLVNSVIVTGLIVVAQLVTCTLSGYAFAVVRFRGRNVLFGLILSTMMVPLQATIIPVFILIRYMGLSDTRTGLVLPAIGGAFGTFLMRQYFLQMPRELGEAARVDGASHFAVFIRIYARMAAPPMAVLATLNFAGYWNEFFRPLIFLQSPQKFTLPVGLVSLQGSLGTGSLSIILAGVVLALIPSIAIFAFAQRYFIEGITVGAIR